MDTYFEVDPNKCVKCYKCVAVCEALTVDDIFGGPEYWWDYVNCHHCFGHNLPADAEKPIPDCLKVCPTQAISYRRY